MIIINIKIINSSHSDSFSSPRTSFFSYFCHFTVCVLRLQWHIIFSSFKRTQKLLFHGMFTYFEITVKMSNYSNILQNAHHFTLKKIFFLQCDWLVLMYKNEI